MKNPAPVAAELEIKASKTANQPPVIVNYSDPKTSVIYVFHSTKNYRALATAAGIVNKYQTDPSSIIPADYMTLINLIHVTTHADKPGNSSKLDGLQSISTSNLDNPICIRRRNDKNSVCAKCYADREQRCYPSLAEHTIINSAILRNIPIPTDYMRQISITTLNARIEAFGDVANLTQAINYVTLIKTHPLTHFGIWTKNITIWSKAFNMTGKPNNCTMVYSSPLLDIVTNYGPDYNAYIDHTFSVFRSPETAEAVGRKINCGGKKCRECIAAGKNCYYPADPANPNRPVHINELLKEPDTITCNPQGGEV